MSTRRLLIAAAAGLGMVLLGSAGCESTGGGTYVSTTYYGSGWQDPYYYRGDYYYDRDVIVVPPRDRPGRPVQLPANRPTTLPAGRPMMPSRPRPARRR